jgi:hypothetical protein
LLDVWEQFLYGFVITRDLEEYGYDEVSWLKENYPRALKHKANGHLLPLLLWTFGQHTDAQLELGENTVVVTVGGQRIGVENGLALSRHSAGAAVAIDSTVLTKPLQGSVRISDPVSLMVYASINELQVERRDAAMQYLAYLLYHLGGERNALCYLAGFPSISKYAPTGVDEPEPPSLPSPSEVESILFNMDLADPLAALRKKYKGVLSATKFLKFFGRSTQPSWNVRYAIYYRYVSHYNGAR